MGSAIAIFVPFPQVDQYQHIIKTFDFIAELEKKISGQQIVVIAERRILPRESRRGRNSKQPRPRSRTLTAVHNAILDDLVYPHNVLGKRIRYKLDGSSLIKVHLRRDKAVQDRVATFSQIYRKLTGKNVVFEFI